jgi:hypothetical protein
MPSWNAPGHSIPFECCGGRRPLANGADGISDIEGSEPDWRSCEGSSERVPATSEFQSLRGCPMASALTRPPFLPINPQLSTLNFQRFCPSVLNPQLSAINSQPSSYFTPTGTPAFTRPASRTISQFANRIQPWLAALPIVSGSSVP